MRRFRLKGLEYAAVIAPLLVLYVGAYYLMVDRALVPRTADSPPLAQSFNFNLPPGNWQITMEPGPKYLMDWEWLKTFFLPVHRIDKSWRQHYWSLEGMFNVTPSNQH